MPAILTNAQRIYNAQNFEEAFSEESPDNLYVYLGRSTTPWPNENAADTPLDSPAEKLINYDEMIGVKQVNSVDVIPVIKRIDWVTSIVYDEYDDTLEIVGGIDSGTGNPYQFYVITDTFDVYKCLSNNLGIPSTVKPTGHSVTTFATGDGYIWKYLFTVNTTFAINYLNSTYIPLRTLTANDSSDQWLVQQAAINGSVEHIIVTVGGTAYDDLDPPAIVITGAGSGAIATPVIVGGVITKIVMSNIGSGYTDVIVTVDNTGVPGSGATARGVLSPIGGHGFDIQNELGSNFRMIVSSFDGDEGGNVPDNVDYRQIGILLNPFRITTGIKINASNITGTFVEGETVTGATSTATGTVIKYIPTTGVLYLSILSGAYTVAETISSSNGSGTVDIIDTGANIPAIEQYIAVADLLKGSGDILYINNRTKITRFSEQEERVKLVITF